jgi:hypothetical protein
MVFTYTTNEYFRQHLSTTNLLHFWYTRLGLVAILGAKKVHYVEIETIFVKMLATCFHDDFLLGLLFNSEDGSNMFLQNVLQLSTDCTTVYPRR